MAKNLNSNNVECVLEAEYLWDIKNIGEYDFQPGEYITSSQISIAEETCKSDWKLRLYPGGLDKSFANHICIKPILTNCKPMESGLCTQFSQFSIVNGDRKVLEVFGIMDNKVKCVIKKDTRCEWVTHKGTLSILCKFITLIKHDMDWQFKDQKILRLFSTSILQMETTSSTVTVTVTNSKQIVNISYGHSFMKVQYHKTDKSVIMQLIRHPQVECIWFHVDCVNSSNIQIPDFKLVAGIIETIWPYCTHSKLEKFELKLSVKFAVITSKDCIAYDFISKLAEQQEEQSQR